MDTHLSVCPSMKGGPIGRRGDGIYQRGLTCLSPLVVVTLLLWLPSVAEARFDRTSWLKLYDSPVALARDAAVACVYGMANGLTIAEAMDCGGVEGRGPDGAGRPQMSIYPQ